MDLSKFDWIDWDPEDDEKGNTAHCRRLGLPEQVVYEVLSEEPVEIKLAVQSAEGAFVGSQPSTKPAMDTAVRYVIQTRRLATTGDRMESQAGGDSGVGAGHLEQMEGAQMNDEPRRSEQERREEAHQHAGDVVAGSGRAVAPRRLGQMVSVRLEPGLVEALRELASRRGISVSEALREGAVLLLEADEVASKATVSWHVVSVPTVPTSGAAKDVSAAS